MVPARPEPGRLRLHVHLRHRAPRSRPAARATRAPTACGARRCATTTTTGSTATPPTASTRTATSRSSGRSTRRARARTRPTRDYRGPYANSEPENFAYDRLLRRIKPIANLNYHSAAQLLNSSFGFITNRPADDNTLARSLTGTDGDAAVDPYQPDQASDLYVTHGETVDWAYFQFGTIGFTPELDTAQTARLERQLVRLPRRRGQGQRGLREEPPARAEPRVERRRRRLRPPANFFDDASRYKVKATLDIEPTVFDVSYGGDQIVEAVVRKDLGPTDFQVTVSGPGGRNQTLYLRGDAYKGGERYGDVPGKYFQRVRATVPAAFPPTSTTGTNAQPRPVITGDTVTVTVRAGGQEQIFTYKVVSTQQDKTKKRILVVAAEDYTGTAPNKTPTPPRRATSRSTSTR